MGAILILTPVVIGSWPAIRCGGRGRSGGHGIRGQRGGGRAGQGRAAC